jgi:hypothetical protein
MQWVLERPKAALMLGQALVCIGGFLVICGLIGRAGLTAINHGRALGKLPAFPRISDAYPMYPLWWVPQGVLGYAFAALVLAAGIFLALTAKTALKARGHGKRKRG